LFNRNAGQAGFEQRTGRELNGMLASMQECRL
jgi:hypothetical protein